MSLKNFVFRFQWCIFKWFLFLFYLRFTRLLKFLSLRFIHDKFFLRALSSNEMPAPRIQCGPAWSALLSLGGTLRAALPLTQWAGSMSRYHSALLSCFPIVLQLGPQLPLHSRPHLIYLSLLTINPLLPT